MMELDHPLTKKIKFISSRSKHTLHPFFLKKKRKQSCKKAPGQNIKKKIAKSGVENNCQEVI
jgi:hypothetical protein